MLRGAGDSLTWKLYENHRKKYGDEYGIFLSFYGEIIFKEQWLNWFLPLRIGIIKSQFHYFRHQDLKIPWFLDFWGPGNLYLWPLLYQNTSKSIRKYMETCWKILSLEIWDSKIRKKRIMCVPNILNFWNFEILKFWIFEILKFYI